MMLKETCQQKQSMLITYMYLRMVLPYLIQAFFHIVYAWPKSLEMLKTTKHKIGVLAAHMVGTRKEKERGNWAWSNALSIPLRCTFTFDFPPSLSHF